MAEKGIRTVWIDSDSVGVLGTKVYRDDILIATVPIGTQIYNDPTAIVGVEYKYEVQAYTSSSESTDETLGVNMDYYEIVEPVVNLTPIMNNFRVEDANKDRVYFDTPLGPVTGLTTVGFVINGKNIGIVNTTENYFTVDTDFTYWDNNTIRLGENDDTVQRQSAVYNFTLEYIENKISEPDANVNKFVSANGTGDGSSEGNASSLSDAFANAVAGETWWMKAGDYGNLLSQTLGKDANATSPIKFIGYKTDWANGGDITTNYFDYGVAMDTSEMPTLSGSDGNGDAIYLNSCSYIVFRNIQMRNYEKGFRAIVQNTTNNHMVFDRCNGYVFDQPTSNTGIFLDLESVNASGQHISNDYCKIIDCVGINSSLSNFNIYGDGNNLLKGIKSYSDYATVALHTDYHIAINGHNNIVTDCLAFQKEADESMSIHGIGVRGSDRLDNDYNLIEKSTAINTREGFYVRNFGCDNNVIKDCIVDNPGNVPPYETIAVNGGLWIWGGCNDNIYERCTVNNARWGIGFRDNEGEDGITDYSIGDRNIFRNCLITNTYTSIYTDASNPNTSMSDNKIQNCTFDNGEYFFLADPNIDLVNLEVTNCMITNSSGDTNNAGNDVNYTYNNFFGNTFGTLSGTGNKSINPDYDANYKPQADFSQISVSKLVMNVDDIEKNERADDTTIGYIKSDGEQGGTTPPIETYDYYVSEDGNGDGSSESTPMSFAQSQTTINSMTSGQSIAYKGGDEFYGSLSFNSVSGTDGNPITITSYGTGQAIITGAKEVTGWTLKSGETNIYEATVNEAYQVWDNNVKQPLTRTDTYSITAVTNDKTQFTIGGLTGLAGQPDLVGGDAWVRGAAWSWNKGTITAYEPTTGEITCVALSAYEANVGEPAFVMNHVNLLESNGDWAWDQTVTGKLYYYSDSGTPTNIKVTQDDYPIGISLSYSDYIAFDNIELHGFNKHGIEFKFGSSNGKVTNCTISDILQFGVYTDTEGDGFEFTNNNAVRVTDLGLISRNSNALIENNTFTDIGQLADFSIHAITYKSGMEAGGSSLGDTGFNQVVRYNTFTNIGYNAITHTSKDAIVEYNKITGFCNVAVDGSAIYTYNGSFTDVNAAGTRVSNNIIYGAPGGIGTQVFGIYCDDRSHDIIVENNSIEEVGTGIYLHNTQRVSVLNNNVYNTAREGIHVKEDSIGGEGNTLDNVITGNNILTLGNDIGEHPLFIRTQYTSVLNMATYGNNAYFNPNYTALTSINVADPDGSWLTLAEWQAFLSPATDLSIENTSLWTGGEQSKILSNYSGAIVSEPLVGTWYELDGTSHVTSINIPAYGSVILIDTDPGSSSPVYGPELVINGDFSDGTNDWIIDNGAVLSVVNGELNVLGNDGASKALQYVQGITADKSYNFRGFINNIDGATHTAYFYSNGYAENVSFSSDGNFDLTITPSTTGDGIIWLRSGIGNTRFDNISIREIL